MGKYKLQTGSVHLVVAIVLVMALMGALGFIFWQNFMKLEPIVTKNTETMKPAAENIETVDDATIGVIEGSLTYPSEGIPDSLVIHATDIDTGKEYSVNYSDIAAESAGEYSLEVPAGSYYVYGTVPLSQFSNIKDGQSVTQYRAYYDLYVKCKTSATTAAASEACSSYDKSKAVVTVVDGKTTSGITVGDWWNIEKIY